MRIALLIMGGIATFLGVERWILQGFSSALFDFIPAGLAFGYAWGRGKCGQEQL